MKLWISSFVVAAAVMAPTGFAVADDDPAPKPAPAPKADENTPDDGPRRGPEGRRGGPDGERGPRGEGRRGGRGRRGGLNWAEHKDALGLSDEQVTKLTELDASARTKMQETFQKMREEGGGMDREAMRAEMTKVREEIQAKQSELLTEEQREAVAALRAKMQKEREERRRQRGERGGPGRGGPDGGGRRAPEVDPKTGPF